MLKIPLQFISDPCIDSHHEQCKEPDCPCLCHKPDPRTESPNCKSGKHNMCVSGDGRCKCVCHKEPNMSSADYCKNGAHHLCDPKLARCSCHCHTGPKCGIDCIGGCARGYSTPDVCHAYGRAWPCIEDRTDVYIYGQGYVKVSKPKSTTPEGAKVNPIQLRFESELKQLDGRDEDFPQQVTALADQYRERMKRYDKLKCDIKELDRMRDIDGRLLHELMNTCAQHVADIPAERLDP